MERFPTLNLLLRFGSAGAIILAVAVAALIGVLAWPALGWIGVIVAVVAALLISVIGRSYIELITLITEMLVPR